MYVDREQIRMFTDTDTLFQSSVINLQSSTNLKNCSGIRDNALRDILLMQGFTTLYGIIDYAGYNIFKNGGEEQWRFCQGVMFTGFNLALSKLASPKAALGFSLQVWGGVPDMVYYGIDKISGGFGGFSNGNELNPHKNLKQLNFMPTVIGSNKVRLSDLITNNLLTAGVAILIQF
jgi:hypothetical protein